MEHLSGFLLVFAGGGAGSVVRYAISLLMAPWALRFPLATLLANVMACFIMGAVLAMYGAGQVSESRRLLLLTGFCGGFSTFSTFTAESVLLAQSGQWWFSALNIAGNFALCLLALLAGKNAVAYF